MALENPQKTPDVLAVVGRWTKRAAAGTMGRKRRRAGIVVKCVDAMAHVPQRTQRTGLYGG